MITIYISRARFKLRLSLKRFLGRDHLITMAIDYAARFSKAQHAAVTLSVMAVVLELLLFLIHIVLIAATTHKSLLLFSLTVFVNPYGTNGGYYLPAQEFADKRSTAMIMVTISAIIRIFGAIIGVFVAIRAKQFLVIGYSILALGVSVYLAILTTVYPLMVIDSLLWLLICISGFYFQYAIHLNHCPLHGACSRSPRSPRTPHVQTTSV